MSKYSHFEMCEKIFGQKYKWNEQKHDYEPYSRTDMWNKMIEQQDKISDLEAKLAESEKQIKDAREAGNVAVGSWCKNRRKYEAQIAEMQNKSFILYSMLYETLEKQGCDNVASQIDQMTGWTYDKEADWLKGNRNYDQLKKQLAEKEKEIESYKHFKITIGTMENNQVDISSTTYTDQDKISFAVEQLEKTRKLIDELLDNCGDKQYKVWEVFDNQIKQLKEMK